MGKWLGGNPRIRHQVSEQHCYGDLALNAARLGRHLYGLSY